VLLAVVLVPFIVFALIIVIKVMSGLATPEPTPTQPVQPSVTKTSSGKPSPQPTQVGVPGNYQNDDYKVPDPDYYPPDLPQPASERQATDWMQSNIFYQQPVPSPVRCEVDMVDAATASKAELQTYLDGIVACLMRLWAPELEDAGFYASRPSVTIYSGTIQSPCGKLESQNAFYCSADQQIYYARNLPSLLPDYQDDPFLPVEIMAHEFGHAIQAQTGILWSEGMWQQTYMNQKDKSSANAISRRTELQADCFAGAFLNSVSQSLSFSSNERKTITEMVYNLGDDTINGIPGYSGDHGQGANRQYWFKAGLGAGVAGTCNTYDPSIPSAKVK